MRSSKIVITSGIIFLLAVVARAATVTFDYDHSVNFSNYRTFMWIQKPTGEAEFMEERIVAAINVELVNKGVREVSEGADLAIGANVATKQKHTWEAYYHGSAWKYGCLTTKVTTYEVGTLTVDLFDAQSSKLIWQGLALDEPFILPEERVRNIDEAIEKMFKKFPPETYDCCVSSPHR